MVCSLKRAFSELNVWLSSAKSRPGSNKTLSRSGGLEEGMLMTEPDAESTETGIVPEAVPAAETPVETGADEAAPATTEESE